MRIESVVLGKPYYTKQRQYLGPERYLVDVLGTEFGLAVPHLGLGGGAGLELLLDQAVFVMLQTKRATIQNTRACTHTSAHMMGLLKTTLLLTTMILLAATTASRARTACKEEIQDILLIVLVNSALTAAHLSLDRRIA